MQIRAEIFFGRMHKAEHPAMPAVWISDTAFRAFLNRKFAAFSGFTVLSGVGFWKGDEEPTNVVVLYGPNTPAFRREIALISRAYADEFKQEAVAYTFTPAEFYLTNADQPEEDDAPVRAKTSPAS